MNTSGRGPLTPGPDCASYAPLLPLLATGVLDVAQQHAVRRHAAGCFWCRAQIADYAVVDVALQRHVATLMMDAPSQTVEEIMSLAETPLRKKRPIIRTSRRGPRRLLSGVGALAAVLLLVVLFQLIFSQRTGNSPRPATTALPTPTVHLSGLSIYLEQSGLHAFRASDGSLRWTANSLPHFGDSSAFSGGMIYGVNTTFSVDGAVTRLVVVDASNGKVVTDHEVALPAMISPHIAVVGDTIYLTTDTVGIGSDSDVHGVYALRASDGSVLWSYPTTDPVVTTPVVANGVVYASAGTTLLALRADDGTLLWRTPLAVNGRPAIGQWLTSDNDAIYIVAGEKGQDFPLSPTGDSDFLYALRPADGSILWRFDLGGDYYTQPSTPVIAHGVVYVRAGASSAERARGDTTSAHLYALRARDGRQLWQYQEDATTLTSSTGQKQTFNALVFEPVVAGDFVCVYDFVGNVIALQAGDGSLVWKRQIAGLGNLAGLTVAGGALFVSVNGEVHQGVNGGTATADPNLLIALRAGDGSTLWTQSHDVSVGGGMGQPIAAP
ncbi:MAG TPA: PQQ-binding-like beta-propeller repeat protein [Ktedonobacterales bacterium]|nr:PQQ-binding-like beta-propeller repeat protein [Ktedonobacterales bacterium]